MSDIPGPQVIRWTTRDVAPAARLDYWASALSEALIPMAIDWAEAENFESEMTATSLGSLSVMNQSGSAHRVTRGRVELARSADQSFHLLTSLQCPWTLEHRGPVRMEFGDVILTDSRSAHDLCIRTPYTFVNLKLSLEWLQLWVPQPAQLIGQRISRNTGWGRALSSYLTRLSSEFICRAPLPPRVLEDHVGGLLTLVADERRSGSLAPRVPGQRALLERIRDCIAERCSESALTAPHVALSTGISVRTLHRVLAACGKTFGALLLEYRLELALRLLESPLFDRVTIAEIGRRAGFSDPSHFTRSIRRRFACTPAQIRNRRLRGTLDPMS